MIEEYPPAINQETSPARRSRLAPQRAVRVIGALVFASVVCLVMVIARALYARHVAHTFIVWNLLLAWIPAIFAFLTYRVHLSRTRRNVLFAVCALTWFFFFPNAPYIITDFVHLNQSYPPALLWSELFIIASFAWTGLCLGYVSLCLMQEIVRSRFGRVPSWLFVLVMLGLGSLGIYLGRFLRWNSWDVLKHPWLMLHHNVYGDQPFAQPGMTVFLGMMFAFLVLSYGTMYSLAHLHGHDIVE